mgnify:CR=1 FL=1
MAYCAIGILLVISFFTSPALGEREASSLATEKTNIDLNSASFEQLKSLPDVTETTARKIIDGRPYEYESELLTKQILDKSIYEKIKYLVIVRTISEANAQERSTGFPISYVVIPWLLTVLAGSILGYTKKLTVFRNYDDLGLVFLIVALPLLSIMPSMYMQGDKDLVQSFWILVAGVTFGIFGLVVLRTYHDNPNVFAALVALITKLTLSIFFVYNLLRLISPGGKTAVANQNIRGRATVWLLILAPLVYGLVRDKQGVFDPDKTLRRYVTA